MSEAMRPDVTFAERLPHCACCRKRFTGKWTAEAFLIIEKLPLLTMAWKYVICDKCMTLYRSGEAGRAHFFEATNAYHAEKLAQDEYIQCGA